MDDTNDFDELYNEGIVDLRFHLRNYALANGLNHVDRFIREAELAVKVVFDGFGNDEDTQITAPADGTTINETLAPKSEAVARMAKEMGLPLVDIPLGEVRIKRLDEARQEMIDALVEDRIGRSPHSGDLRWYVCEYYSGLADVDLTQEFNDAGLGDD